jgi:hypothetical protein
MHLKVFLKAKKTPKNLSLLCKYIKKKTKKPQKTKQKTTGLGYFLKTRVFFQPCLRGRGRRHGDGRIGRPGLHPLVEHDRSPDDVVSHVEEEVVLRALHPVLGIRDIMTLTNGSGSGSNSGCEFFLY